MMEKKKITTDQQALPNQEPLHVYLHKDWNLPHEARLCEPVTVERETLEQTKYIQMSEYDKIQADLLRTEVELAELKLEQVRNQRRIEALNHQLAIANNHQPTITTLYGVPLEKILTLVEQSEA
jgi:hypothetical protein